MENDDDTDWTEEGGDVWSRLFRGLLLRVSPDPDEPWTWEVLEVADETTELEIDAGGAESLEEATEAAEEEALLWQEENDEEE